MMISTHHKYRIIEDDQNSHRGGDEESGNVSNGRNVRGQVDRRKVERSRKSHHRNSNLGKAYIIHAQTPARRDWRDVDDPHEVKELCDRPEDDRGACDDGKNRDKQAEEREDMRRGKTQAHAEG